MQSNFLPLKDLQLELFDHLCNAEKLFSGSHFEELATRLRKFCEAFLMKCFNTNPKKPNISNLITDYSSKYYNIDPNVQSAITKIQKIGNDASHSGNDPITKEQALELFELATVLVNYFIIDFLKKKNIEPIVFDENNFFIIKESISEKYKETKIKHEKALNKTIELAQIIERLEKQIVADDHKNKSHTEKLQQEKQNVENERNKLEKQCQQLQQEKQQLQAELEAKKTIATTKAETLANTDFDNHKVTEQQLQLNDAQQQIIALTSGKQLLQAPPGSGKTSVLTARMKTAIANYHEEQILCLTFTSKAATELKLRVKQVIGKHGIFIGTFHGFCLDILRNSENFNSKYRSFSILDDQYRTYLLEYIIDKVKDKNTNLKPNNDWIELCKRCSLEKYPKNVKKFHEVFFVCYLYMRLLKKPLNIDISLIKKILNNQLTKLLFSASEQFKIATGNITMLANKIWQVFHEFAQAKLNYKTLDFNDVLFLGLDEIIQQNLTYDFIQVDEVQDLSPIQWGIINQLCYTKTHILVAGDTEQLIYSFLNASEGLLNNNTKDYQNHSLTKNYRSTAEIIDLLNNYRMYHWNLPAMQTTKDKTTNLPTLIKYVTEVQECNENIQIIKQIPEISDKSIAILLRSNDVCEEYCNKLKQQQVNFFQIKPFDLMKRNIIQDWLSLLRVYQKSETNKDWWRLIYRFAKSKPKIKRSSAMDIVNSINIHGITIADILTTTADTNDITSKYPIKNLINAFNTQGVVIFEVITDNHKFNDKITEIIATKICQGKIINKFSHSIDQNLVTIAKEFFTFVGDCPLISHDDGFNYSILRLTLQREANNYELLKSYYSLHKRKFSSLNLAQHLFPEKQIDKSEDLVNLVTEIINALEQRVTLIDNILTQHQNIFVEVIKHYYNIDKMLEALTEGDQQVELADILTNWLEYIKQQPQWYDKNALSIIEDDINKKLIPWLKENNYRGVFNELINEKNSLVERLFTLKEIDLIDIKKYQVIVCTIHQSKGLEFNTVFVPQVTNRTYNTWYNSEATRVLYVALSRATENLIVSYATYEYLDKYGRKWKAELTDLLTPCISNFKFSTKKG